MRKHRMAICNPFYEPIISAARVATLLTLSSVTGLLLFSSPKFAKAFE